MLQVRTLNKVAMVHPMAVTNCNIDLESLIVDQNRPIATLAITTLLKTGSEGSVDRLLKQIGNFMSDIADEFKIVVVEAIRALCLKFPQVGPCSSMQSAYLFVQTRLAAAQPS